MYLVCRAIQWVVAMGESKAKLGDPELLDGIADGLGSILPAGQ